jgi:predicted nuclease of restriction endonuclease-like (RecB) superfamily
MVRFVEAWPGEALVSGLAQPLGWSHFKEIPHLPDSLARQFYAEICRMERWSVRTLRERVRGMLYERTAISRLPEAAIRQELERFLLEPESDFAFVAWQKRMTIGDEDFYVDLLFYHRRLARLVVIDLKPATRARWSCACDGWTRMSGSPNMKRRRLASFSVAAGTKSSAANVIKDLEGITKVENRITALPLSPHGNNLGIAFYRTIYGQSALNRYAMQAVPSIHIIVDKGNVILDGVVANDADRKIANIQANSVSGVFSVQNNLRLKDRRVTHRQRKATNNARAEFMAATGCYAAGLSRTLVQPFLRSSKFL